MKTMFLRLLLLVGLLAPLAGPAVAQDASALKQRMADRVAAIDAAKTVSAIGENNQGLLEARSAKANTDLIAAENADRMAVYSLLAKRTGTTPEAVGQARARQIAAASSPGVWLQGEDDTWYKKK